MILTVTPNPALDVTYDVDALVPGTSHRVRAVRARAGGKGVNVARTLGRDVLITGFAGGVTGDVIKADLDTAGLPHAFVSCAGETRRTMTIVAAGDATVFNEPGPFISPEEWEALESLIRESRAAVVVISGSLPADADPENYARLAKATLRVPVIVDTSGPALAAAAPYASVVKPNATELAELLNGSESLGSSVVLSRGADGLVAYTEDGVWRAIPPRITPVNPTGAGDAVVASLARTVGAPWPERLRDAVALSAATVLTPVAGSYDAAAYRRFLPLIEVGRG